MTAGSDFAERLDDQYGDPNDIEATGRCCCAGCVGMGPCDLDPPRALGGDFDDDPDAGWDDDDQPPPADVTLPEPDTIQPLEAYL